MKKRIGERIFEGANTLFMLLMIIVDAYTQSCMCCWHPYPIQTSYWPIRDCCFTPWVSIWMHTKKYCNNPMVTSGFANSLFYVVVGTFCQYGCHHLGRLMPCPENGCGSGNTSNVVIIFTMFFSGGLIPTFLLVRNLGLYDSRWGADFAYDSQHLQHDCDAHGPLWDSLRAWRRRRKLTEPMIFRFCFRSFCH